MSMQLIARSVLLFVLAGLCEIGGGYLVWQWLREGRALLWGALGGAALFLYGVIPTFQPAHFGRVYAAYGGFFVVLSLLWGWILDGDRPDRYDAIGAAVTLAGVFVIMYWPR
jgi:small multidrug resistance family-3 protein